MPDFNVAIAEMEEAQKSLVVADYRKHAALARVIELSGDSRADVDELRSVLARANEATLAVVKARIHVQNCLTALKLSWEARHE